jgi:hypothetical protein
MNERINQLKTAANNVTKNKPEQFAEVFGLLIYNDVIKIIKDARTSPDTAVTMTADGSMAWDVATLTTEVNIKQYFGIK